MAKFGVIIAAVDAHGWALALIAMISAVVAAFLYLRIIVSMYLAEPPSPPLDKVRVPWGAGVAAAGALLFTLLVGFVPGWLITLARHAVPQLAR